MKSAETSALVNASRELLHQNDADGAHRVLAPIISRLGNNPEALHLMGLIKRTLGHLDEAERYLRSAVAYSLDEGGYYNDLAVVLQALGQREEAMRLYRAALVLTPKALSVRANMVECLLADDNVAAAEQEARAYVAVHPSAESWMLLGQVQQAMAKNDAALASANAAVQLAPTSRNVQFNYAGALDKVGRNKEALAVYRKLAAQSLESADLALALARALYADGEKKQAEAAVEQGLAKWPQSVALHSTLVRIRALRGEDENATALLEAEVAKRPDDLTLRLACADALHRGKHYTKALSVLETGLKLAPDNQGLLTAFGIVLDELDRPLDGLTALRRAAEVAGDAPASRRNMLSSLIRAGQPQEALRLLKPLRAAAPDEQYLIACEALALRVLGDPGYRALSGRDLLNTRGQISAVVQIADHRLGGLERAVVHARKAQLPEQVVGQRGGLREECFEGRLFDDFRGRRAITGVEIFLEICPEIDLVEGVAGGAFGVVGRSRGGLGYGTVGGLAGAVSFGPGVFDGVLGIARALSHNLKNRVFLQFLDDFLFELALVQREQFHQLAQTLRKDRLLRQF
jgi:Flp pilus assembly protein TadD